MNGQLPPLPPHPAFSTACIRADNFYSITNFGRGVARPHVRFPSYRTICPFHRNKEKRFIKIRKRMSAECFLILSSLNLLSPLTQIKHIFLDKNLKLSAICFYTHTNRPQIRCTTHVSVFLYRTVNFK